MENIERAINKAIMERNATRLFYYQECLDNNQAACSSFDKFKNSFAYNGWIKRVQPYITEFVLKQNKQFPNNKWHIEYEKDY